ncbi:uncharacterized protein LOC143498996 [Brachyhypopomus gauderio]|uniref:uncharacterized protein LOC143498996 n=1 Tax=Brachyhypopomus gauderio TaxID=698409 RepID=UPI004041D1C0
MFLQVSSQSLYVTNDMNVAIFPASSGFFNSLDLSARCHYEVHGESMESSATPSANSSHPFTFMRPVAAGSSGLPAAVSVPRASMTTKYFQRSVYIADLVGGKLAPSRMVVIRFMECEATVQGIIGKVQEALGSYDPITLTDAQGNAILESEGTKGSQYWKQNARKILAVTERDFQSLQGTKRKRMGRKDEETSALGDVTEKIEELLLASQGLDTVTATIRELSELALTNSNMVILTSAQSKTIKDALSCAVCKGPMVVPMFAVCCQSLIGCKLCNEEWLRTSTQCLRCRAENFASHVHVVLGLCDVLLALRDAFGDD